MTLDQWIKKSKCSVDEFARSVGVTSEAVRRYRSGERMPEPFVAQRIVEETKGRVSIQDLHDVRLERLKSRAAA
jgi:transcriptional regulator with XRE-family HTH domain